MKMGMEVYRVLEQKIATAQEIQLPLPVSDEGAFTPLEIEEDREALLLLDESIKDAGYEGRIKISLDMAASAFYKEGLVKIKIYKIYITIFYILSNNI